MSARSTRRAKGEESPEESPQDASSQNASSQNGGAPRATPPHRRICWRCIAVASLPFAAMIGVLWLLAGQLESGRAEAVSRADAAQATAANLSQANATLQESLAETEAELTSAQDGLSVMRAAAAAEGALSDDDLLSRLRTLPDDDLKGLVTVAGLASPLSPTDIADRIDALSEPDRDTLFRALSERAAFSEWIASLPQDARDGWVRSVLGGDKLATEVVEDGGEDPATRYETMRTERDLAVAQRASIAEENVSLRQEREALMERLSEAESSRAAAEAQRDVAWRDRDAAVALQDDLVTGQEGTAAERDAALAARDAAIDARDEAINRRTIAEQVLADLHEERKENQEEIDRLQLAVARLEAELADMRAELAAARAQ